jgi:hypothetical protein
MKCEYGKCTITATMTNLEYFKGIWYCTLHGNKAVKEGRRKRKYGNKSS